MITRDAPTVLKHNRRVEALEMKDRRTDNMIYGMGRGDFNFGCNGSVKIVVGEWR